MALANTITHILTPTMGWRAVTNEGAALMGADTETDVELRARQAVSTSNPSQTVLQGIVGGIAQITGVTRYRVLENDTDTVDSNGIPAHSIAAVVEGGEDKEIAQVIHLRKTPGTGTYGEEVVALDSNTTVCFQRPEYIDVDVTITLKPLVGYTTDTPAAIKGEVAQYINTLSIGDTLPVSALWAVAMYVTADLRAPSYSITGVTACAHGGTPAAVDIAPDYNQAVRGAAGSITIVEAS